MKATQRRLTREVPAIRRHMVVTGLLTTATATCVVLQASLLARVLSGAVVSLMFGLAGVVVARAVLAWAQQVLAQRAAATVKAELRGRVLDHVRHLGPLQAGRERHGELATTVTRGLDALDPYFTGYLPKTVGAAVVPPLVIACLAVTDWVSAVVVVVTLPLIPVFGALVGLHTRKRTERQWALLSRLGGHFLDVVAGLPTLRAFGRARHEIGVVRRMSDDHRRATMRTLRVAFLSSLVLEWVATLSVALVAVPVGLRLLSGSVDLETALTVLLLAPEAYLPLRAAGSAFHDSAEGVAVADQVFAALDDVAPPRRTGTGAVPDVRTSDLVFDRVTVRYPDRDVPAVTGVSMEVRAGECVGLIGPSGAGKSTLLAVLLGFVEPESGRVLVGGHDLADLPVDAWREQVAWVPQKPHLFAVSVADNIRLGRPCAPIEDVVAAARAASADEFVTRLTDGYDTILGENGTGLSMGQRQRIAIARAFLRDAPILLLDEATAHLDPASEAAVAAASARLMAGRTTLVIAHRPALLDHVDRVVEVHSGRVAGRTRSTV
ncbi:thiol reductant ABC exporter subunit CydD [Kibdelosporangium phytohabitans]|uniref:Glutathione/cysteine ABC transporter ATP-binding protein n=1 Tax=Kibdelosporangium phytohabitans TaxID=860235 RepID=A0A0N9I2U9_9PSEU|nr:thiol reductant ABC exporter subunit CydD [Kibdelosporangium phytohabitans]ALG08550.1 glutathione/cysteine ABC transporter ATP-binding protein [Kibdelosporangium phytohabitans]MBE1470374.1 ATP-binding cassette subfamily C protein CydD [Kibdelosporangium phytohabitans]